MRGICTSQHAMVGQFAWRKIANLSNRRLTPPVSEVSSEHATEQNNQKYHYHHYYHHYDHDHAVHHRCTSGLTRHDIQHTTHDSIPRREPLRQHPLPA